jgi:hypothetical protein
VRILFILKKQYGYGDFDLNQTGSSGVFSSGLSNSVRFVVGMLQQSGVDAKFVDVVDNNDIDREVFKYAPTHVVIEALWVIPEKFVVLTRLYPDVVWVVRTHSELPFLAGEGVAVGWLIQYSRIPNVFVASNSERAWHGIQSILSGADVPKHKAIYLPNYYPLAGGQEVHRKFVSGPLNVGCFGAIRPLKNQLIQANAALNFAASAGLGLHFHINTARLERGAESILSNLRSYFANREDARLIEHPWYPHADFLNVLRQMDLGMQVSFSETFNIVAADMVSVDLPIVVSPEISWAAGGSKANPTDVDDIVSKMGNALGRFRGPRLRKQNAKSLRQYSAKSEQIWLKWLGEEDS